MTDFTLQATYDKYSGAFATGSGDTDVLVANGSGIQIQSVSVSGGSAPFFNGTNACIVMASTGAEIDVTECVVDTSSFDRGWNYTMDYQLGDLVNMSLDADYSVVNGTDGDYDFGMRVECGGAFLVKIDSFNLGDTSGTFTVTWAELVAAGIDVHLKAGKKLTITIIHAEFGSRTTDTTHTTGIHAGVTYKF